MPRNKHATQRHNPSRLERLNIDFEYNKTLREIKHDVRLRTDYSL